MAKSPRLTPLIGEKVWFGPRGWGGWGWQPVSWEGWLVTGIAVTLVIVIGALFGDGLWATGLIVGVTIALTAVCHVKGTSPGSVRAKRAFDRQRNHLL